MPAPTRWQATQALKQVTAWGERWGLILSDPMARVPNMRPRRREVQPPESWDQVLAVAQRACACVETGALGGGRDASAPHLRPAPYVCHVVAACGRRDLPARAADGHERGDHRLHLRTPGERCARARGASTRSRSMRWRWCRGATRPSAATWSGCSRGDSWGEARLARSPLSANPEGVSVACATSERDAHEQHPDGKQQQHQPCDRGEQYGDCEREPEPRLPARQDAGSQDAA